MKPVETQHGGPGLRSAAGRRRFASRIPRRWLLFIVPALLLAAMLIALAVQGMVREVVVPPLAYALWLADLVIRSVPQATFWTVLLAIGVYITLRGLVSSGSGRRTAGGGSTTGYILKARKPEKAAEPPIPSRLEQCQLDMQRINESAFAREKVAFDLRQTVLDVLAYREHQEPAEIEWRVRTGSLDTPPEIRALLLSWPTWFEGREERTSRAAWLARILQWLGLRRQVPAGPQRAATGGTPHAGGMHAASPSLYEYKVEQVIVYLENQLSSQPERQAASEPLPEERTVSGMYADGIHAASR
jgi:hypothetical protein